MADFIVKAAGPLSLIQDQGRVGQQHLGLTTGGVADMQAYYWLNRLLGNEQNSTCIELTLGGLTLVCQSPQIICVTGANAPLLINDKQMRTWCCHRVNSGDIISIGYANKGVRAYLGVKKGFDVTSQFGSTSTVVREKIGGLNAIKGLSGKPLISGDKLQVNQLQSLSDKDERLLALGDKNIPRYSSSITLRLVLGYQHSRFNDKFKGEFLRTTFEVSKASDRMGYRLAGGHLSHDIDELPSEGICFGAVQIPPDGQPIVLLNDRQTLGGYPKIGSVLSIDACQLLQARQGATVRFEVINVEQAVTTLRAYQRSLDRMKVKEIY